MRTIANNCKPLYLVDKQNNPTFFGRIGAKLFAGADDYIAIHGINMKPQELLDLLSERVNRG